MKKLTIGALSGLIGAVVVFMPDRAQAYYDAAWDFVCDWECGEAAFEWEYGGYTVHGYAEAYHSEFPDSEWQAYNWAYYDYWLPADCEALSTHFAQTVCLDTAFFHGLSAWDYFADLYWGYSDDEMACMIIDERSYWRSYGSPYDEGWYNRDADLAAMGGCWG